MDSLDTHCFLCNTPCPSPCSHCHQVYHCIEHKNSHRPNNYCFPFTTSVKEGVGRCLLATRNISPLEVILSDHPGVVGPDLSTAPICLHCFRLVDGTFTCPGCGLPMCGHQCSGGEWHKEECIIFQGAGLRFNIGSYNAEPAREYELVMTVRVLLAGEGENGAWLWRLMDHKEEREEEEAGWREFGEVVVDVMEKVGLVGGGESRWTREQVYRAGGVVRTNAYAIEVQGEGEMFGSVRVLFPLLSLMSHSCQPNMRCIRDSKFHLNILSQVAIPSGQELCITYLPSLFLSLLARRSILKKTWFFDCQCIRCSDASDGGTHLSGVLCPKCEDGVSEANNPLDLSTDWICTTCRHSIKGSMVRRMELRVEKELEEDKEDMVEHMEDVITKYSGVLHDNHALIMKAKAALTTLYGSQDGYDRGQLNINQLNRKIQLCISLSSVLGTIDPGITDWRGVNLYEMTWPKVALMQHGYSNGKVRKAEMYGMLESAVKDLELAIRCLEVEPEGSYEKKVETRARAGIKATKKIIDNITKL